MRALSGGGKGAPPAAPGRVAPTQEPASGTEPGPLPAVARKAEVPPQPPIPRDVTTGGIKSEPTVAVTESAQAVGSVGSPRLIGEEMSDILREMCRRGEFSGAVVADDAGLPVADFNCQMDPGAVAACGSVLADTMQKAGRLLNQQETNNISMDIGYVDKITMRRFEIGETPYFLMVICPRTVDERKEIQVSINRIMGVLGRGDRAIGSGPPQASSSP